MGNLLDCAVNPLDAVPGEGEALEDAPDGSKSFPLDGPKALHDSILWELQRSFYEELNIKAWSEGIVPNFVTTNSFVAKSYARVVSAVARDFLIPVRRMAPVAGGADGGAGGGGGGGEGGGEAGDGFAGGFSPASALETALSTRGDPSQPTYVFEIGAGHGKLGHLVVENLLRLMRIGHAFPRMEGDAPPFKYIMTDFSRENVEFWKSHDVLQPCFKDGTLDVAVYNAETDTEMKLEISGQIIKPGSLKNHAVVFCNYVFDTLTNSAFQVRDGKLYQSMLTLTSPQEEEKRDNPEIISRMKATWTHDLVEADADFFGDEEINAVVKSYANSGTDMSFLLPVGGLRLMKGLSNLTSGRMVLLAGDKGYTYEHELQAIRDPHIAIHGSFSFMVNFHALTKFVESRGGFAMHTPHEDGFRCAMFVLGAKQGDMPLTRWAFKEGMQDFGPENFSTLQRRLKEECHHASLKHILALIRLSNHDSDVFYKFKQTLVDKAGHPYSSANQKVDIREDIALIHTSYYPLQKSKDICFELARLYMGLRDYADAIEFFKYSNEYCGHHHVTWHNMGVSFYYLSAYPQSYRCFKQSLSLNPSYREARVWMARVESKLREADEYEGDDADPEGESEDYPSEGEPDPEDPAAEGVIA